MQGCWVSSGPGVQPVFREIRSELSPTTSAEAGDIFMSGKTKTRTELLGKEYRDNKRENIITSGFEFTIHLHVKYCMHFWHFFIPKKDVVYPKR